MEFSGDHQHTAASVKMASSDKPSLDFVQIPMASPPTSPLPSSTAIPMTSPLPQPSSVNSTSSNPSSSAQSSAGTSAAAAGVASTVMASMLGGSNVLSNAAASVVKSKLSSFWQQAQSTDPQLAVSDDLFHPDTPLLEELDIDPKDIALKYKLALLPTSGWSMEDEDKLTAPIGFWGPLFAVFVFGVFMFQYTVSSLSWVLGVWIIGSLLLWGLLRSFDAPNGFPQVSAVCGYGALPLLFTLFLQRLLEAAFGVSFSALVWSVLGIAWAAASATSMLVTTPVRPRLVMIAVPVTVFYIYMVRIAYLQVLWAQ